MPVRASEVAELADVIFTTAEDRPLNDDLRARVAGRLPSLGLQSLIAYPGSLMRDPQYASAYYLAVDSIVDEQRLPYLLHMTLASAPSNPVYPKALLIGRLRPGGGREIVVDAVPFGSGNLDNVRLFIEQVDTGFAPKATGIQSAVAVTTGDPRQDLTAAFEAFRQIRKNSGVNLAAFRHFPHAGLSVAWAAVRAGWRFGYSLESQVLAVGDPIPAECSAFRIDVTDAEPAAVSGFVAQILKARRPADIELVFRQPVDDLAARISAFKTAGVSPQLIAVPDAVEHVADVAPVVRAAGASISFSGDGLSAETARTVGRTAGRFRCRLDKPGATTDDIVSLVANLRA